MSFEACFVNREPFTKRQIVRLLQIDVFADNKIHNIKKIDICVEKGRKHCRKRRKCWLPAFSPFPTVFSKGFFLKVVKSRDCVVNS